MASLRSSSSSSSSSRSSLEGGAEAGAAASSHAVKRKKTQKKKKKPSIRARNYCFTVNHEPQRWYDRWSVRDLPEEVQFIVFQLEIAPTTGHLHVQGYVQLTKQLGYARTQEILRSTCHLEAANGSLEKNITYCTKEATRLDGTSPVQRGNPKEQGRRTDLESLAQRVVKEGKVSEELVRENPGHYVRYFRGFQALSNKINKPKDRRKPKVYFLWGSPGCGKSRLAHHLHPEAYSAVDMKENWFDGYDQEHDIIFDDFEGNIPLRNMLKLLDYYRLQLPVKGGFAPIAANVFVFTSNIEPTLLYGGDPAWLRRLRDFAEIWDEDKVKRMYEAEFVRSAPNQEDSPEYHVVSPDPPSGSFRPIAPAAAAASPVPSRAETVPMDH